MADRGMGTSPASAANMEELAAARHPIAVAALLPVVGHSRRAARGVQHRRRLQRCSAGAAQRAHTAQPLDLVPVQLLQQEVEPEEDRPVLCPPRRRPRWCRGRAGIRAQGGAKARARLGVNSHGSHRRGASGWRRPPALRRYDKDAVGRRDITEVCRPRCQRRPGIHPIRRLST